MTAERDAVVEAMARAMRPAIFRRPDSAVGEATLDERESTRRQAAAAYDAALPLIVGPLRELADNLPHVGSCRLPDEPCSCRTIEFRTAVLDALPGGEQEPQCECEMGWQCDFCRQFSRGYNGGDA
jgi:hypothetical protein